MPRVVVNPKEMRVDIYWDYSEWCKRLPLIWLEICGCKRECNRLRLLDELLERKVYDIWAQLLLNNYAVIEEGKFVIRCNKHTCTISPWPKHVYKPIAEAGGTRP